jgi:PAS domain S-box-containing protein
MTTRWQAFLVAALMVLHLALGAVVNTIWREALVLNHLAYIPLVLAGMWWGRRAAPLALIPGLAPIALTLLDLSPAPAWSAAVRAGFYLVVTFVVGSLADRVRSGNAAVHQSEASLRDMIENSLTGVAVYRDERLVFCNTSLIRMLAGDGNRDTFLDRAIWDFVHPEDRVWIEERITERRQSPGVPLRYEARLVRTDGSFINADIASFRIEFQGAPSVLVSVYDVTPMREAETRRMELFRLNREQEEQLVHSSRLAELGEMAAAVAHELNQPLTGIRNFARNAAYMIENDAGSTADVRNNLNLISDQVDRAARIIQQMRSLARRTAPEQALLQVNAALSESLDFLRSQFRLASVDMRVELDQTLPPIMGDRIRLEQVFLNLLVNARQAMEDSTERVMNVWTRHEPEAALPVVIGFQDTGRGFDQSEADRIFQPFYTTKPPGRGTGLGLSISMTILQEHEGRIEAYGEPGKGARFILRLPAAPAEVEARATEAGGVNT